MLPLTLRLPVKIMPQPDELTCGPTCLHAIYQYWGETESLEQVISRTQRWDGGGTLAVFLACDALRKGYQATIYTYNLMMFDPTWFKKPGVNIAERLRRQNDLKQDARIDLATHAYLEFLNLGGALRFLNLSRYLIRGILRRKLPILTGLSSTYLYQVAREFGPEDTPDDIRGVPAGHFVVIAGYNRPNRTVLVADPYSTNPYSQDPNLYWINVERVVAAILLGIVTHDANLLIIHPRREKLK